VTEENFIEKTDLDNEIQIIKQCLDGDMDALAVLSKHYLPKVYRRVWFSIPSKDAEDVTQEVFITLVQKISSFKMKSKFSTWLFSITQNKIADYYRKNKNALRNLQLDDKSIEQRLLKSETNITIEKINDVIMLRTAMSQISSRYREILILRYYEGLSIREISSRLNLSYEAAKSLYRRAIASLRNFLREEGN